MNTASVLLGMYRTTCRRPVPPGGPESRGGIWGIWVTRHQGEGNSPLNVQKILEDHLGIDGISLKAQNVRRVTENQAQQFRR